MLLLVTLTPLMSDLLLVWTEILSARTCLCGQNFTRMSPLVEVRVPRLTTSGSLGMIQATVCSIVTSPIFYLALVVWLVVDLICDWHICLRIYYFVSLY